MLVAAVNWSPEWKKKSRGRVLSAPGTAHYIAGWPRDSDLGVIAEADGEPIGAAWLRFFPADDPGYGFVAAEVPELTIGVAEPWRGQGVGRALLRALASHASSAGIGQISLSVERKNPARTLYLSEGYRVVDSSDAQSDTMLKDLAPGGGRPWIDALPDEMAGQRALLRGLLDRSESDRRIRWLVVACSVGRGAGDRLSDLDLGIGVADEDFDAALADVRRAVDGLGDLVDSYRHQLPGLAIRHERIFAQYADRCQIDLVVVPASQSIGAVKDEVVLYDADGRRTESFEQAPVPPERVREWAFAGWCALADLGKYLRRGSLWEALNRLHDARSEFWRLLAVALDVPNPQYGITSILDFAPDRVPPGLAAVTSDLDAGRLLAAARSLAGRLNGIGDALSPGQRAALPAAMAGFVTGDLDSLAAAR